ncbi:hypothetical protein N7478_007916 [Penicillium angulare]|uniref:uncharacterized protein n=1 Tax=Penicillium angulare TaxID=116970 RepID=UPI0025405367|nr:uncharacterized protein N7478_007916 [Penicillium angulare]KAJ5272791.1 hypothetical protein N7478_007916 [Penicillium angulare]
MVGSFSQAARQSAYQPPIQKGTGLSPGIRPFNTQSGIYPVPMTQINQPRNNQNLPSSNRKDNSPPTKRGTKRSHTEIDETEIEISRKHGKRLTTKEEVSLFEICNKNAHTFGKRSDICNWWRTIAEEFTRAHGRPYSWHSVRRKVEMVTKQRLKFLEDQSSRELTGVTLTEDSMNPQWCAVLDAWMPTWIRWEQAEIQRIAKRDEMIRRRSSVIRPDDQGAGHIEPPDVHAPTGSSSDDRREDLQSGGELHDEEFLDASSAGVFGSGAVGPGAMPMVAGAHAFDPVAPSIPSATKLPPGYDSMFTTPLHMTARSSTLPVSVSMSPPPGLPHTNLELNPILNPTPQNNHMFNAVLETLGKLNKHLDTASANGGPDPRSSPVISALVQAASESGPHRFPSSSSHLQQCTSTSDIDRIKEELRHEMRAELRRELSRDRAALEEKLDSVQKTQEMILQMLRHGSS